MIRSKQTSAHVYASIEIDYEGVECAEPSATAGRQLRASRSRTCPSSRGSGRCDPRVPRSQRHLLRHRPVVHPREPGDRGRPRLKGLMVPVVRDAEGKRMRAIAREIKDLADRAKSKKLTPTTSLGARSRSRTPARPARSSRCRSSTSRRWRSCRPMASSVVPWSFRRPTGPKPSPSTRSATWRSPGTTGPSTGCTPRPSSFGSSSWSRRDWASEL